MLVLARKTLETITVVPLATSNFPLRFLTYLWVSSLFEKKIAQELVGFFTVVYECRLKKNRFCNK